MGTAEDGTGESLASVSKHLRMLSKSKQFDQPEAILFSVPEEDVLPKHRPVLQEYKTASTQLRLIQQEARRAEETQDSPEHELVRLALSTPIGRVTGEKLVMDHVDSSFQHVSRMLHSLKPSAMSTDILNLFKQKPVHFTKARKFPHFHRVRRENQVTKLPLINPILVKGTEDIDLICVDFYNMFVRTTGSAPDRIELHAKRNPFENSTVVSRYILNGGNSSPSSELTMTSVRAQNMLRLLNFVFPWKKAIQYPAILNDGLYFLAPPPKQINVDEETMATLPIFPLFSQEISDSSQRLLTLQIGSACPTQVNPLLVWHNDGNKKSFIPKDDFYLFRFPIQEWQLADDSLSYFRILHFSLDSSNLDYVTCFVHIPQLIKSLDFIQRGGQVNYKKGNFSAETQIVYGNAIILLAKTLFGGRDGNINLQYSMLNDTNANQTDDFRSAFFNWYSGLNSLTPIEDPILGLRQDLFGEMVQREAKLILLLGRGSQLCQLHQLDCIANQNKKGCLPLKYFAKAEKELFLFVVKSESFQKICLDFKTKAMTNASLTRFLDTVDFVSLYDLQNKSENLRSKRDIFFPKNAHFISKNDPHFANLTSYIPSLHFSTEKGMFEPLTSRTNMSIQSTNLPKLNFSKYQRHIAQRFSKKDKKGQNRSKRSPIRGRTRTKTRSRTNTNSNTGYTLPTYNPPKYRHHKVPPTIKPIPKSPRPSRSRSRNSHLRCKRQIGGRGCKRPSKSTFKRTTVQASPNTSHLRHTQQLVVPRDQFREFHSNPGMLNREYSRVDQQARATNGVTTLAFTHVPKTQKKLINTAKTNEVSIVQNFQKEIPSGQPSAIKDKLNLDFDKAAAQIAADHSNTNFLIPTLRRSKSTSALDSIKTVKVEPNSGQFRSFPLAKLRTNEPMIHLQNPRPLRSYNIKSDPRFLHQGTIQIPGSRSTSIPKPAPRMGVTARPVDFRKESQKFSKCGGTICDHVSLGSLITPEGKILPLSSGSHYESGGLRAPKPLPRSKNGQFLQTPNRKQTFVPTTLSDEGRIPRRCKRQTNGLCERSRSNPSLNTQTGLPNDATLHNLKPLRTNPNNLSPSQTIYHSSQSLDSQGSDIRPARTPSKETASLGSVSNHEHLGDQPAQDPISVKKKSTFKKGAKYTMAGLVLTSMTIDPIVSIPSLVLNNQNQYASYNLSVHANDMQNRMNNFSMTQAAMERKNSHIINVMNLLSSMLYSEPEFTLANNKAWAAMENEHDLRTTPLNQLASTLRKYLARYAKKLGLVIQPESAYAKKEGEKLKSDLQTVDDIASNNQVAISKTNEKIDKLFDQVNENTERHTEISQNHADLDNLCSYDTGRQTCKVDIKDFIGSMQKLLKGKQAEDLFYTWISLYMTSATDFANLNLFPRNLPDDVFINHYADSFTTLIDQCALQYCNTATTSFAAEMYQDLRRLELIDDIYPVDEQFADYLKENGRKMTDQFASEIKSRFDDVSEADRNPYSYHFNNLATTIALNVEANQSPLSTLNSFNAQLGFVKKFFQFIENFN